MLLNFISLVPYYQHTLPQWIVRNTAPILYDLIPMV